MKDQKFTTRSAVIDLVVSALCIGFLFLLCKSCSAEETTPAQERTMGALELTYDATLVLDVMQTIQAQRQGGFVEKNMFLGKHPDNTGVFTYFVAMGLAHAIISRELVQTGHDRLAKYWEYVTIGYEGETIANNARLGVKWKF